ncbi:MAG: sulfate ABC transporter ATP-binding protein [Caulobacterales bacterium]
MSLEITDIRKSFGRFPALKGVSLTAHEGEFLALLGPSGSGKTTLLRVLAGLETPETGAISFRGEDLLSKPVRAREIGFVFQHYALFRHMTVANNIAFGMRAKKGVARPSAKQIRARVSELLDLVQLSGLEKRYPSQLSGGQRQRVALARALAIEPQLLLLDEPFGALDAKVRRELRRWLREVHERTGLTTIFVTHDQEEALELADRVALLREGQLEQVGTPEELYHNPQSAFAFEFLGDSVKLDAEVSGGVATIAGFSAPVQGASFNGRSAVYARPDSFTIAREGAGLPAEVRSVLLGGADARVDLTLSTGELAEIRIPYEIAKGFSASDRVFIAPRELRAWPEGSLSQI